MPPLSSCFHIKGKNTLFFYQINNKSGATVFVALAATPNHIAAKVVTWEVPCS